MRCSASRNLRLERPKFVRWWAHERRSQRERSPGQRPQAGRHRHRRVIRRESMGATAGSPGRKRPQLLGASYKASARILRATPEVLRHAAAAPGGTAWFWLSAAQRRAALDNYAAALGRSEEHTSELQSQFHLVCRLLLEKKKR